MNRNYQKEMERIIRQNGVSKPRLLLHACCGPCSSSVLERVTQNFKVTILWYNPNIYPESEFTKRLDTLQEVILKLGLKDKTELVIQDYRSGEYYKEVRGLENEPEGGRRCARCFELRLREAARIAKEQNFDYFCTTLTLSRHKNAALINAIGEKIGEEFGVKWLPSDFKKKDGENRSIELCEQYNFYRQLYCGCEFSLRRREEHAAAEEAGAEKAI